MPGFRPRIATAADIPALVAHMDRAITGPLADFLTPDQIAASRKLMGIDSQLIADGTYGGDHTPGRVPTALTPGVDAARIRAMYTAPAFVRQGVGRLILSLCEIAARQAGFDRAELVATLGGEPLYRSAGYREIERFEDDRGGAPVPLVRMGKRLVANP